MRLNVLFSYHAIIKIHSLSFVSRHFCIIILTLVFCLFQQVWFQNRRAKFRRNERNILAQRQSLYGRPSLESPPSAMEQPIAPRPTPMSPEYLSWSPSAYSPVTSPAYHQHSPSGMPHGGPPPTSSSCAMVGNTTYGSPPMVGSSIASLRLKAREYNMHQHYPMTAHQMQ